jgi:hypothetical protein
MQYSELFSHLDEQLIQEFEKERKATLNRTKEVAPILSKRRHSTNHRAII